MWTNAPDRAIRACAAGPGNITGVAAASTGTPARIEGGQRMNPDAITVIACSKSSSVKRPDSQLPALVSRANTRARVDSPMTVIRSLPIPDATPACYAAKTRGAGSGDRREAGVPGVPEEHRPGRPWHARSRFQGSRLSPCFPLSRASVHRGAARCAREPDWPACCCLPRWRWRRRLHGAPSRPNCMRH